jgi:hypothetical protein
MNPLTMSDGTTSTTINPVFSPFAYSASLQQVTSLNQAVLSRLSHSRLPLLATSRRGSVASYQPRTNWVFKSQTTRTLLLAPWLPQARISFERHRQISCNFLVGKFRITQRYFLRNFRLPTDHRGTARAPGVFAFAISDLAIRPLGRVSIARLAPA